MLCAFRHSCQFYNTFLFLATVKTLFFKYMPHGKTPLLGIARTGVFYLEKEMRLVIGYG